MSRLLSYSLIIFLAVVKNAYASVDMQCVNNCTSKGYQYQLCAQRCSYDTGAGQAPQPQIGTAIPIQGNPAQVDSSIPLRGMRAVQPVQPMGQINLNGGQQESQQSVQPEQQRTVIQQISQQPPTTGYVSINVLDNGTTIYANPAAIVKSGNNPIMWSLFDARRASTASDGTPFYSEVHQQEYDCNNTKLRNLYVSIRTDRMGGGEMLPTTQDNNWEGLTPNTIGYVLWDYACRQQPHSDTNGTLLAAKLKFNDRYKEICTMSEFAVLFKRTECYAKDITFEQLTDGTKITKDQKTALPRYRALVDAETKRLNEVLRSFGGTISISTAGYLESVQPEIDKYNLDLYNGLITWGSYNQHRKELSARMDDGISRLSK